MPKLYFHKRREYHKQLLSTTPFLFHSSSNLNYFYLELFSFLLISICISFAFFVNLFIRPIIHSIGFSNKSASSAFIPSFLSIDDNNCSPTFVVCKFNKWNS